MLKRDISSGRKRFRRVRRASGFSLVETLVSLLVGAVIAGTMVDMYSKVQSVGATTQNETMANLVLNELLDQTRSFDYEFLNSYRGQKFDLLPNLMSVGESTSAVRTQPVLLDLVSQQWTDRASAGRFRGTVTYEIQQFASDPNSLKVIIVAAWSDSERQGNSSSTVGRSKTVSTVVTKYGANLWQK